MGVQGGFGGLHVQREVDGWPHHVISSLVAAAQQQGATQISSFTRLPSPVCFNMEGGHDPSGAIDDY